MKTEGNKIEMNVEIGDKKHSIYFKSLGNKLILSPESIIAATLLPSMKFGEPLITPTEADPKFLSSLDQIQDIFSTWDESFSKVSVEAKPAIKPDQQMVSDRGVGTFFTGGVDSFYTFLKHKDEITHLIYVHGYEKHRITTEIQGIAKKFNKEVIEIETNLRDFSNPIVRWVYYIGPSLVTIGHLLKKHLKKIYIPSTFTYNVLIPSGTHPLVDPLWSSSDLNIIHDGCESTRVEKISLISKYEVALNSLRVCWKDVGNKSNCGECEKCIRTMLNLKAVNLLDQCSNFPNTIPLRKVARMVAETEGKRSWVRENLNQLKENGDNQKLVWALLWVLYKPYFMIWLRRILVKIRNKIQSRFRAINP